jgi:hypothetical protein
MPCYTTVPLENRFPELQQLVTLHDHKLTCFTTRSSSNEEPIVACLETLFYSNRDRVYMKHSPNSNTVIPKYQPKIEKEEYRRRARFLFSAEVLNNDILSCIFQFLKVKDIVQMEQVCLQWKCIGQSEHLWKSLSLLHLKKYSISEQDIERYMSSNNRNSYREFLLGTGILQASWFECVIRSLSYTHAVITFRIPGRILKTVLLHHSSGLQCDIECYINPSNLDSVQKQVVCTDHCDLREAIGRVLMT